MKKFSRKILSLVLALSFIISMSTSAIAAETIDPYNINSNYVQELVDINCDEFSTMPIEKAHILFEKAFNVPATTYTEDNIRTAIEGLSIALKMQVLNQTQALARAASTTSDTYYYGSVGVAWVRDTTKKGSPLTLGEILSGTYTLEVDYITWDTAASILAASANYNAYQDLVELVATGATGTALGACVTSILGLTGAPATIASLAVGVAVSFGWNWLKNIERSRMYDCFEQMSKSQLMKVQFMWSSNSVNKLFSTYTASSNKIENPFPGICGEWKRDTCGHLYSY